MGGFVTIEFLQCSKIDVVADDNTFILPCDHKYYTTKRNIQFAMPTKTLKRY